MITRITLCVLLVFISPFAINADEIFDNGLDLTLADFASFSFTGTTTGAQYQIADDFTLGSGTNWRVDGLRFTGILFENGSFQPTIGEQLIFDIMILADQSGSPTGTPLDPIPGTSIAWRQATAIGVDTGIFTNGAEFSMSFDPIVLTGGTPYWMVIAARDQFTYVTNVNPDGTAFAWIGRSSTGNAWQGGTNFQNNWLLQSRQQDFTLFGKAVPEPGSLVCLQTIMLLMIGRRRR